MEEQNPLQFFIDLAEERPIRQKDETSPYRGIGWEDKDVPADMTGGFDDLGASFDDLMADSPSYWYSSYFERDLPAKMFNEKQYAISSVDTTLAGMNDLGQAFSKLTEFITSVDAVISKLNAIAEVKQYPAVLNACQEIKTELSKRKKRIIQPTQTDKDPSHAPVKLQWLGQVNVLGTLFYHMLKGQDGGPPYISASVEQVKRMLVDNFVDCEGHDLSKATLDTIFMPSRSEKRANIGDRIELPNKKSKK